MGVKLYKQVAELTKKAAIKVATYYANVACPFITYQPTEYRKKRVMINFMKKNKILPIMLVVLLAITGCSRNYEIDESTETISFEDYNYDNNNAQLQCVGNSAISESGYYLVINGLLYYYDISTDFCSPCCYNANCNHSDEKCAAYLNDITYKGLKKDKVEECYGDTVFYYDNKIYMVENNKHEEYYLNQYNVRFGDRTRVAIIADNNNKDITTYLRNSHAFKIKDGYLYYVSYSFDPKNVKPNELVKVTNNCMRIKLADNAKPEKLGEFEALPCGSGLGEPDGFKILFDSNNVYYISGGEESRLIETSDYKIARYNTDNGDFKVIFEYSGDDGAGAFGSGTPAPDTINENCCMDKESNLYFISQDRNQIIQYSVSNKTSKCFYASVNTINSIAMDGEQLFISEYAQSGGESRIVVSNLAGEVIQNIKLEWDSDYINQLKSHNQDMTNTIIRVNFMCVDDRYIVLTTKDPGLKELNGNDLNNMSGVSTVGTAVVKKSDILDGKITDIKQIYRAK
ncbi:cyclic lactone autoinducer peptide [Lachnospira eligens]|jgi:cyclic lactone autoinducer peptide|uniref:cyclic lactone autoinducer peptide n=1 Tax=Lachnospira eligens TaxID=39485 RepID=UPI0018986D22|nr:cyclic lactone autoinducer peptide [Lachnospira eligens]